MQFEWYRGGFALSSHFLRRRFFCFIGLLAFLQISICSRDLSGGRVKDALLKDGQFVLGSTLFQHGNGEQAKIRLAEF
jgi:hypothetical protein